LEPEYKITQVNQKKEEKDDTPVSGSVEDDSEDRNTSIKAKQLVDLADAISAIKLSQMSELKKYSRGDNFSRFCERFIEHVHITKIRDPKLYIFFMQNVDDETYTLLKTVSLSDTEKANAQKFCKKFEEAIYNGDDTFSMKNALFDCKQKRNETISEYADILREIASIAYSSDQKKADENCLLAFLRGVRDYHIKKRINEETQSNFNDTVNFAKRLERVDSMMRDAEEKSRKSSNKADSSYTTSSKYPELVRSQSNRHRGRERRYYPDRPRDYNRYKTCWNCLQVGHVRRFCKNTSVYRYGSNNRNNNHRVINSDCGNFNSKSIPQQAPRSNYTSNSRYTSIRGYF